jgi:hypothetical protein
MPEFFRYINIFYLKIFINHSSPCDPECNEGRAGAKQKFKKKTKNN